MHVSGIYPGTARWVNIFTILREQLLIIHLAGEFDCHVVTAFVWELDVQK